MVPYPVVAAEHSRTELDPETQMTRYYNAVGVIMQSPRHGTSSGTKPATNTGNPSDGSGGGGSGGGDADSGNDTDQ
ncbi:putative ATP-grasp-modified RiPP [Streptomyces corynorhini]|nr:putative ATP-grasp-modified RiPP [Streptomyces corynorhini]